MKLFSPPTSLFFQKDGAELYRGAAAECFYPLRAALDHLPHDRAGVRLHGQPGLRHLLSPAGAVGSIAASLLGPDSKPVRAISFEKSAAVNWSLGWHQDRTVCVRDKIAAKGFGPWTFKNGMHHVAPPFDLLARMVTLRVHLDDVPATNAPLMISPGSHRAGRIAEPAIPEMVRRCGIAACLAKAGDIWAYSTPILHASPGASVPARRRVLQIDYAAEELPARLEWLGV